MLQADVRVNSAMLISKNWFRLLIYLSSIRSRRQCRNATNRQTRNILHFSIRFHTKMKKINKNKIKIIRSWFIIHYYMWIGIVCFGYPLFFSVLSWTTVLNSLHVIDVKMRLIWLDCVWMSPLNCKHDNIPAVWMRKLYPSVNTICWCLIYQHRVTYGRWGRVFYFVPNRCISDLIRGPVEPAKKPNELTRMSNLTIRSRSQSIECDV